MIPLYTAIVIAATIVLAFFTASEMAFTSVNRRKLKSRAASGDKAASKLDKFLAEDGAYLGATLVGTNIAIVVSSVFATRIFVEYFGRAIAPVLVTAVMVPVILIFAEIVPKMIARQFSTAVALGVTSPVKNFYRLFYPLIVSVNSLAGIFIAPFKKLKNSGGLTLTKRDLKQILTLGHESGEVEADELELIHKVLDFESKKVESIMVPLYRVTSLSADDFVDTLKKLVALTGFSRIPVYEGNKNNIVGILNIYDIFFNVKEIKNEMPISDFIRDAVFVDREDGLDIALARLRHRKQPMGIVSDKAGKICGIVTIEDMLEEIVGEIEDGG